jgi:DNA repair exonuclease SbcCD ATPase subunit
MKEIARAKKLEVAQYYILGHLYADIENRSGVSHGSIVNIVKELECGKLAIPGSSSDQVDDLRQLSVDLNKRGLEPSQALLGVLLFDRLRALGITPELVDRWSKLAEKVLPADFPANDFIEAALRLDQLEESEGKPFRTLSVEYVKLKEGVGRLKLEMASLGENKKALTREAETLRSKVESLEATKNRLENAVEIQTTRLNELKSRTKEIEEEKSRLRRDTQDLRGRKTRLSSEVDHKEELLKRLNAIGLSEEDLLRITNFIERTSKNEGISGNELKKRFFSALASFQDISGLENRRKVETQQVNELSRKKSALSGEIAELDNEKGLLEGEVGGIISSTLQRITAIGEDAASQMQQHVDDIKEQLNGLLADALKAGEAIGEMRKALKSGEESGRSLSDFVNDVQNRVRRN